MSDVNDVTIGETVRPREACPYCHQSQPTALGVDAFPAEHREEVIKALFEGASFYECNGCAKRWAVMKQSAEKAPKPMKKSPHLYGTGNRKTRRTNAVLARRAKA